MSDIVPQVPARTAALSERLTIDEVTKMKGIASALAQSGVFRDAGTAPVAFTKMVIGRELGLNVGQSMTGIHLVEGGIQMHYATMLACVRAHGYDYRVREHTEERCTIEWGRGRAPGKDAEGNWIFWPEAVGMTTYTMADAEAAGLFVTGQDGKRRTARGKDSNYQKVPKNMLLARNVSNGTKEYVPEALGGMPVYVLEEPLGDPRYVDGTAEPEEAESVSLTKAMQVVPGDLRDRAMAAYGESRTLRPGVLTPAAVQMALGGQPREFVEKWISDVEAANARAKQDQAAEEPPDAEVVPKGESGRVYEDQNGEPVVFTKITPPDCAADDIPPDVQALSRELSGLLDQRVAAEDSDRADAEAEVARMDELIDEVERKLADAGGETPGQEQLL